MARFSVGGSRRPMRSRPGFCVALPPRTWWASSIPSRAQARCSTDLRNGCVGLWSPFICWASSASVWPSKKFQRVLYSRTCTLQNQK